ncbi:hypothetical protein [Bradyrhizobium cenepequi]
MVASKARGGAKKRKPRRTKKATRGKAGRPEIQVTAEQRERVEVLIGGGMALEEIAAAMDLSPKTLTKHFKRELLVGRSKKRAEVLVAMFKAANGGNVSAQKAYLQQNLLADADDHVQNPSKDDSAPAPSRATKVYKGKKEVAQEEAMTAGAGTEWGSDLDPTAPGPDVKPN